MVQERPFRQSGFQSISWETVGGEDASLSPDSPGRSAHRDRLCLSKETSRDPLESLQELHAFLSSE